MIVVSNTSPLTNLAAIGPFDLLLHKLFGKLYPPLGAVNALRYQAGVYVSEAVYQFALQRAGEFKCRGFGGKFRKITVANSLRKA